MPIHFSALKQEANKTKQQQQNFKATTSLLDTHYYHLHEREQNAEFWTVL